MGYSSCLSSSEQPSTSGSAGRRAYSTDDGSKPVESIGNEKVQALATQIMGLTVLEASWLSEILRKKLNIQKPAFGAMPMGMPVAMPAAPSTSAPAASAADAAPVEKKEKTEFEVKLASFTPEGKIKVIKEIRAITNLGLKEAKELVSMGSMGTLGWPGPRQDLALCFRDCLHACPKRWLSVGVTCSLCNCGTAGGEGTSNNQGQRCQG